jgi:arginine decarboxylase
MLEVSLSKATNTDSKTSLKQTTPYHIDKWSEGKFTVNEKGHLCLAAQAENKAVDLIDIIETMKNRGIQTPCVIRFQDILVEKVHELNQTFNNVIEEYEYAGDYCGVYPIKVNQMREVVEEIVSAGKMYRYGLEAGSKAELLAVLAYNQNRKSVTIINGYKDEEFIRLCLLGLKMGHNLIIVVESLNEIETTLKLSKEMNLDPQFGFRIKTSAKGLGKWANSAGEQAKFGLGLSDLMNGFYMLKKQKKIHCLKLIHFHLGSQLSDIKVFREGLTEVSRVYCELKKMGAGLEFLDVGGGLAVDYDGSKSSASSSKNYSLLEYAQTLVDSIQQTCSEAEVKVPHLITESGRYITAHHSCIFTEVIDVISPTRQLKHHTPPLITGSNYYENMLNALDQMCSDNLQSSYHDILFIKKQTLESFRLGHIGLAEHSQIDELYWAALDKYMNIAKAMSEVPESLKEVEELCSKQYLCNLSIFQSAADSWAIGQLLPIAPLQRLHETATENCTIADITCDSDGKIEKFIQCQHDEEVFKLHTFEPGKPYYLGLFLTGAYQDVMGDNHNLFGRLNEIHVYRDALSDQGFYIEEFLPGSSKSMVLSTMQYHDKVMSEKVMAQLEQQMQQNKLNHREAKEILNEYNQSLHQYTYLNTSS